MQRLQMKVKLIPKSKEEQDHFLEISKQDYIGALMKAADLDSASAEISAKKSFERSFKEEDGVKHLFFSVFDDEQNKTVGGLWFTLNHLKSRAFLFQILIYDQFQGKGYGKRAMSLLHSYCKEQGMNEVSLSVFGFNKIALGLYENQGYDVKQSIMRKRL